jgi:hypothetical protein
MAEQWSLKGDDISTCICDSPCPCLFGEDPTKGNCDGIVIQNIRQGNYGSVDLSGRTFALVASWEGNIFSGDMTVGFLVDQDATDEQIEAFETILTGKAGGAFEGLSALYGTVKGIKRAPIEFGEGAQTARVGATEVQVQHLVGADQQNPLVVTNSAFDFGGAGLKVGKTHGKFVDDQWGFDFELSYAHTGKVDLSS